jgi:flagellin
MFPLSAFQYSSPVREDASARWRLAIERIAAMRRITSATDDAAGQAIAERLTAQVRGDAVAERAVADGQSMAETADGALGGVSDKLQQMRELSLQAGNGALSDRDRASLDKVYQQLGQEVQRDLGGTRFNGRAILGDDAGRVTIPAGADPGQDVHLDTTDLRQDPGVAQATQGQIGSQATARQMTTQLDAAMRAVGDLRASLGAAQSRLSAVSQSLTRQIQIGSASFGRLTDVDLPAETAWLRSAQAARYASIQSMGQFQRARQNALLALLA